MCPLFYYSILFLLVEATVVVRANDAKAVSSVLESLSIGTVKLRFTICEVANDYELGTADALRTLRGRIKVSVTHHLVSSASFCFCFSSTFITVALLLHCFHHNQVSSIFYV